MPIEDLAHVKLWEELGFINHLPEATYMVFYSFFSDSLHEYFIPTLQIRALGFSKAQRMNPRTQNLHVHLFHAQGGGYIIQLLGPRLGKVHALFPLFFKEPNDKGGGYFSNFKAESMKAQKVK